MKLTTRQLTLCAVLTAMALALSYLENFFPLSLAIPIPGIKLGLANIVTLFALYALGPGQALLILLARCLLGAVFAGNMNALIFSLLGGRDGHGGDDRPLPAEAPLRLRSVCGRSSGPQLRPGGRSCADAGQHGAAVLPAGAAGGVPLYRGIDGADRRLPVPGAGTYKTVGGVSGWTSGIRAKRTRSSCGSWR